MFYKELFILSFDEEYSKVIGIHKWIQFLFIVIVAMVISASMRVVGILLVSAFNHVTIGNKYTNNKSFKQLILLSVFLGELSVILGPSFFIWTFLRCNCSSTSYFTYDYNGLSENANEV